MRYRVEQIKLNLDEALAVNTGARAIKVDGKTGVFPESGILEEKIASKIGKNRITPREIKNVEIIKRSIDARFDDVRFVYTIDFDTDRRLKNQEVENSPYKIDTLDGYEGKRPVVVGFGPCGMFAALVLAKAGLKPIIFERGSDVDVRVKKVKEFWEDKKLDPECNVQFGEGGAGTFSDGKLNTGIKDPKIRFVLDTLYEHGAPQDILIDARPHMGTDLLRTTVKSIREEIKKLGGEIFFDTKVEEIILKEDGSKSIITSRERNIVEADHVILAIGHSARDTVRMLFEHKLSMEPKPFSMGIRVQHKQELIDRSTYGKDYGHPALPPAYYKLACHTEDGRGVYSFCMCPGGEIINAASEYGRVATNGMSNASRNSDYANSGILVDVRVEDYMESHPLSGVKLQEEYETKAFNNGGRDYSLPTTTWNEYRLAIENLETENKVVNSLPGFVSKSIYDAMPIFGKKINGFDNEDTLMVAIESRSSSPVRIVRNKETFEAETDTEDGKSIVKGLYPAGEGAGYAGGITSAACDGIRIAEQIIKSIMVS